MSKRENDGTTNMTLKSAGWKILGKEGRIHSSLAEHSNYEVGGQGQGQELEQEAKAPASRKLSFTITASSHIISGFPQSWVLLCSIQVCQNNLKATGEGLGKALKGFGEKSFQ